MVKGVSLRFFVVHGKNRRLAGDSDEILEKGGRLDISYMLGSTANDIAAGKSAVESPLHAGCLAFSRLNEKLGRKKPWVYYFSHQPQGDDSGAFHSAELWYMFGTLRRNWQPKSEDDYALSERMLGYWTNFIKTGDPNDPALPRGLSVRII
jgi:para-nitrobenzyl esterase